MRLGYYEERKEKMENWKTMLDDALEENGECELLAAERLGEFAAALEDRADVVSKALAKAWRLGQTYWQQADSEYTSQHKKAAETQAKFQALVDETRAAILADVTPSAELRGRPLADGPA